MESVRPTDEVYEGDHMGESSGFLGGEGGRGGGSCVSISLPVCSPRSIPVIALRTMHSSHPSLNSPPHTAVWTPQLPRNPHTCVQWRGTDQETPQRPKTVYACMNV